LFVEAEKKYKEKNSELLETFSKYGATNIDIIRKQLSDWNKNKTEIVNLKEQINKFEKALALTNSEIDNNKKQLVDKKAEKQGFETEKQTLFAERYDLFGDKIPDIEENRLKNQIGSAETVKNSAEKSKNETKTELAKTNAIIIDSENRLSVKQTENTTEKTREELQNEYDAKKLQSDESLQKIGAKKQELEANNKNLEKNRNKLSEKKHNNK